MSEIKPKPPATPSPPPGNDDLRGTPTAPLPPGPDVVPDTGAGQDEAEKEEATRHEDWGKR
ncbi:hypothetical protein GCM10023144_42560 [Pigmentiphaga soli]|uniref:Uncharacterized protein n=1 Tax=Pigmentiphaga soli TaxID=1007095 RepID=A0ABP8HN61_9BURK